TSVGSTRIRVTNRAGNVPEPDAVHDGAAAVPFAVLNSWPLPCPTQIASELPGAIAIALMKLPAPIAGFTAIHDGPLAALFGVVASLVRQSEAPPTSSRFELFGSSTSGATKFASDALHESRIA